jgi:hypothetical protein
MPFNEKLNLLMKVQSVSNSRLAKVLSVDPSLISRWRTGARIPSKNCNYIKAISLYFTAQAKMDYQKTALFEIIGLNYDKKQEESSCISELLFTWLNDESSTDIKLVDGFLNKFDMFHSSKAFIPNINADNSIFIGSQVNIEVFHGIDGKRDGVIRFLSTVAAQKKPCTMLLYSDESMEWLTEDRTFFIKWRTLLTDVITKGHRIKIIHSINRDLSDMLSAIDGWLPLYMTGAIEPYYYPKHREHIFKRTMFIAPNVAALTSTTISEHSKKSDQFFYVDRSIIANLVNEFNAYLNMCRPLMQIFTGRNIHKFSNLLIEFEEQPGDIICFSNTLSTVTIPEKMFCRLLDQTKISKTFKEKLIAIQKARIKAFESNIEGTAKSESCYCRTWRVRCWKIRNWFTNRILFK